MLSYLVQPGAISAATEVVESIVAESGNGSTVAVAGDAAEGEGLGLMASSPFGTGAGVGVLPAHAASTRRTGRSRGYRRRVPMDRRDRISYNPEAEGIEHLDIAVPDGPDHHRILARGEWSFHLEALARDLV